MLLTQTLRTGNWNRNKYDFQLYKSEVMFEELLSKITPEHTFVYAELRFNVIINTVYLIHCHTTAQ